LATMRRSLTFERLIVNLSTDSPDESIGYFSSIICIIFDEIICKSNSKCQAKPSC